MNINENTEIQNYIQTVKAYCDRKRAEGNAQRACVFTFGCQQNEADSEKISGLCTEMGYDVVKTAEGADLVFVNTCAIREHAEQRALSLIGELKHEKERNPDIIIGVCGCMTAQANRVEQIKHRFANVDFTLEPNSIYRIPEMIYRRKFGNGKRTFIDSEDAALCEGLPVKRTEKHRAYVSIMYGCNNFCSYCIVPYVRGRERSRASEDIVSEVKSLVSSGCRDITLLGQNVNSYRSDCDFSELIKKLTDIDGDFIIRFMTSHPKDVSDRLIGVIADSHGKTEPHFHLPLQSGSDRILKSMNRKYTVEKYLGIVDKLREKMPGIAITSDIIVGYPGENEDDFQKTLDVMKKVRYDMVYSFIYSPRKGTPAAKMEQVDDKTKGERMRRLLALQDEISLEKNKELVGKTVRVLVDGVSRESSEMYSGRTDAGKLVHLRAEEDDIGNILKVKIMRAEPYVLYGEAVK